MKVAFTPASRNIFSEGILIATGSAFVYLTTFFYEYGYCDHFGIPASFINPNLSTVLVAAATIGGLLFSSVQLLGFAVPLIRAASEPSETQRPYRSFFAVNAILIVLAIILFKVYGVSWSGAIAFIMGVLIVNFIYFGAGLNFFSSRTLRERFEEIEKSEPDAFDMWSLLIDKFGRGWILLILFFVCMMGIAFLIGNGEAMKQERFLILSEEKEFAILRTYGDILIAAPIDRKEKKIGQEYLLLRTSSREHLNLKAEKIGPLAKFELVDTVTPAEKQTAATKLPKPQNPLPKKS